MKNLSITLSAKTLSDTFALDTYDSVSIGDPISGTIKGFAYNFLVEEISRVGSLSSVSGKYDVDEILNKPVSYVYSSFVASDIFHAVCSALGKTAVVAIDNFVPPHDTAQTKPTYRDVVNSLFGWTDAVPQMQINVFMRGNNIYATQRGKETETQTISKYTQPTIKQKKVRTLQPSTDTSNNTVSGAISGEQQPVAAGSTPFSGVISYGTESITYSAGYVTQEKHTVNGVDETTTYVYSNGLLITRTMERPSEKRIVTEYVYETTEGDELTKETETEYEYKASAWTQTTQRITRHHEIGQGFWATIVEVDGETQSTSIGQGSPGGKASPYEIKENNDKLQGATITPRVSLSGRYLGGGSFPVSDAATLTRIAQAITWLNGKTEERVTLDVFDDTVFDFNTTVTFGGNVYYLERNQIKQDPRKIVQSLEIVRWF